LRANPLQFAAGAIVITLVQNGASADLIAPIPSARYPSSLVSRTRTMPSRGCWVPGA
jgi:hypothetical protein